MRLSSWTSPRRDGSEQERLSSPICCLPLGSPASSHIGAAGVGGPPLHPIVQGPRLLEHKVAKPVHNQKVVRRSFEEAEAVAE
jgi:hypothetical protein